MYPFFSGRIDCGNPNSPSNAVMVFNGTNEHSSLTIHCTDNFYLVNPGIYESHCVANGSWIPDLTTFTCVECKHTHVILPTRVIFISIVECKHTHVILPTRVIFISIVECKHTHVILPTRVIFMSIVECKHTHVILPTRVIFIGICSMS